jgi:3-oxoadipate enol-lactonase
MKLETGNCKIRNQKKRELMPYCSCGAVSLYHESHGEGPALLLIAGLGGGSWSWYGQVPYFQNHYRTIIFDNRGAGRSSLPRGPYQMQQLAADARCLMDHLALEKAFVLGLSMGGMIAQKLALMVPQRIQALFLGCTHAGGASAARPARAVMEILLNNAGLTQEQIITKNLPIFFSERCRKEQPDLIAAYGAAQLSAPSQPAAAFQAQLAAINTFDAGARLRQIEIPTMIVTGSEDVLIPPENAKILAEVLPHAEMVVIPGAGHALHAECRDRLNQLAHAFFQRQLTASSDAETR